MPTDVGKLRMLLPHWIEHNAEHAKEFRVWAERADAPHAQIESAAYCLEEANKALRGALSSMANLSRQHRQRYRQRRRGR